MNAAKGLELWPQILNHLLKNDRSIRTNLLTFYLFISFKSSFSLVHWSTKANSCLLWVLSTSFRSGFGKVSKGRRPGTFLWVCVGSRRDPIKWICAEIQYGAFWDTTVSRMLSKQWDQDDIFIYLLKNCTDRNFAWLGTGKVSCFVRGVGGGGASTLQPRHYLTRNTSK